LTKEGNKAEVFGMDNNF